MEIEIKIKIKIRIKITMIGDVMSQISTEVLVFPET